MPERSGPSRRDAGGGGGKRDPSGGAKRSVRGAGKRPDVRGGSRSDARNRPPRPGAAVSGTGRPARAEPEAMGIDPDGTLGDLDPDVRRELRGLARPAAERVARHLVAAARLLDDDPAAALEHARAARRAAARIGAVREANGIAAYLNGEWAEALRECRAAHRMMGDRSLLHVIADCERALGRPGRAIEIARSAQVREAAPVWRAELAMVEAGARSDLGQHAAALLALESAGARSDDVEEWTPRLWYAYAAVLQSAGRSAEAARWFLATAQVDADESTDAWTQYEQLHGAAGDADHSRG